MTQPLAYSRQSNQTDWATNNPGVPPQGYALDAELNAIKVTTDQIRANLALIQRDDTRLTNGSVHRDAFDTSALLLIAGSSGWLPRGTWLTATAYAVRDLIVTGGVQYVAIVAHTSGVFATDLAAGDWMLVQGAQLSVSSVTPMNVAAQPAAGVSATAARDDHQHAMGIDTENAGIRGRYASAIALA